MRDPSSVPDGLLLGNKQSHTRNNQSEALDGTSTPLVNVVPKALFPCVKGKAPWGQVGGLCKRLNGTILLANTPVFLALASRQKPGCFPAWDG